MSLKYEPLGRFMVCSAGQKSRSLYCVQEGQLEVLIGGQVIRVLSPGDSFGEVTDAPSILWTVHALTALGQP